MAGFFSMINMQSNALRAFQTAMTTTGHNISNVNTEGYSRQRVDFAAQTPLSIYSNGYRSVGQGVGVTGINRIKADYLDASLNASLGNTGRFQTLSDGLKSIDTSYGEPGAGSVSNALNKFYSSWSGLAANPGDTATRTQLRAAAQTLTDTVRGKYSALSAMAASASSDISATITQVNDLAQQISNLNTQIKKDSSTGGTPNDLMDQRDLALSKLSGLVNTTKSVFSDGTYAVSVSGFNLVDSAGATAFPSNVNVANGTFTDGSYTFKLQSGSLMGQMESLNHTRSQMANLDTLSNTLRTQINGAHKAGMGLDGVTGRNFFNDSIPPLLQTGAIDFNLDPAVVASTNAIAAGTSGKAGDGGLAQSISDSANTSLVGLGNQTISGYWQANVTQVASDTKYYTNQLNGETTVQTQISQQQTAVSGVSLDDEFANLQKFQRSYQAAAKALTIFDQTTQELIAMVVR